MPDPEKPTNPLKPRARVPSGPRNPRESQQSYRSVSSGDVHSQSGKMVNTVQTQASTASLTSLVGLREFNESPLDALIDAEHDYTLSPEQSPELLPVAAERNVAGEGGPVEKPSSLVTTQADSATKIPSRGRTALSVLRGKGNDSPSRSQTLPQRPTTPTSSFLVSRPTTPSAITSPPIKSRPKISKLNTLNLLSPHTSPEKPISPGLKHWQQVRSHVLAPTPVDEKQMQGKPGKRLNLVSKAAGKFGFRNAAERVIGYQDRRGSAFTYPQDLLRDLSVEEREEITRERRKFARDVKVCLDACSSEETRRRLQRGSHHSSMSRSVNIAPPNSTAANTHGFQTGTQHYNFDPNFSAYAPLLMELHRHLPAARAKKLWSRTIPHHAAILAELSVNFLPGETSTPGERQQALEIFGVIVRNWASDSAEEELGRWLFVCRAIQVPDKQLRNRALPLLLSFLNGDPDLPVPHERPHTATAFQSLAIALLQVLYCLSQVEGFEEHRQAVTSLLAQLVDGDIVELDLSSLKQILTDSTDTVGDGVGGLERELLWLALCRGLKTSTILADWFTTNNVETIGLFAPPPLLHATPPIVLQLRSIATKTMLSAMSSLVDERDRRVSLQAILAVVERYLISDMGQLTDSDDSLAESVGILLFKLELHQAKSLNEAQGKVTLDPFRITTAMHSGTAVRKHRALLASLWDQERWQAGMKVALRHAILDAPVALAALMLRALLQDKAFHVCAREGMRTLFERLSEGSAEEVEVKAFLELLQTSHPQLLYKPLFSLSASTNANNLQSHLRVVRQLATVLGQTAFWAKADPQMVTIVLMGDLTARQPMTQAEDEAKIISLKLGRYACLVELILAMSSVGEDRRRSGELRVFAESLEIQLSKIFEVENKYGVYPAWYQALLCRLFFLLRSITLSVKRPLWLKWVLKWYLDDHTAPADEIPKLFRPIYASFSTGGRPLGPKTIHNGTGQTDIVAEDNLLELSRDRSLLLLLVAVQKGLSTQDWTSMLPKLWWSFGQAAIGSQATAFLLLKCCEMIPDAWREAVLSQLHDSDASHRSQALRKLALLYGWRYQMYSQMIITDRRGPIFKFPARTLEFVATEIGSATWVPPHNIRDEALKKYGTTLPLELRQRLMELGWNEESTAVGQSDWEQMPVSALPSSQFQSVLVERDDHSAPSSPNRDLIRHGSTGSAGSVNGKRRRPVLAPIALTMISEQSQLFAYDMDSLVGATSRELVRLLQRDDPSNFLRPFTDGLSVDFRRSLANLNSVTTVITPSFAYSAFNAIVGYLKTVLRTDACFGSYAQALATASTLVSHVSEISLREIRKYKAEHVLLPASIHEEQGGFKLHAPWRDGSVQVQTAQLLILAKILRVNPREIYLFKKMLSTLPIQSSIHHRPFARAWLLLVDTLFSTVNRNYNDRAELRYFLTNVSMILRHHRMEDLTLVSHGLKIFMLCSARFRRLFASVGIGTIFPCVFELYAEAKGHTAVRDGVEYACRSFYRIHQDAFVYQACAVLSDEATDHQAAYSLLASLSIVNKPTSGVASGLRSLNDKEEIEALVQMISGPELTLSEIGTDAAERQASKMAFIDLDSKPFPKDNIIKLLVTVIAANPATQRAIRFFRFFSGLIPYISDTASLELLSESVEALGSIMAKGKVGDDIAKTILNPTDEDIKSDWSTARKEYILLVETYTRCQGQLSSSTTRRVMEMVKNTLRHQPETIAPASASILCELARTNLNASSSKPAAFLRDIAPLFKDFVGKTNFTGFLEEITRFIKRSLYNIEEDITEIIIDSYVAPAVGHLIRGERFGGLNSAQKSTIELFSSAVFLPGDALRVLEKTSVNPVSLVSVVLPLCMTLDAPRETNMDVALGGLWIRLLNHIMRPLVDSRTAWTKSRSQLEMTATLALSIQAIKIIVIRAPSSISNVSGLWNYIAHHLSQFLQSGNGNYTTTQTTRPRLVNWMMWSLYEMVCLHRSPLMLEMRYRIQIALAGIVYNGDRSVPSSPRQYGLTDDVFDPLRRPRMSSARSSLATPRLSVSPGGSPSPTNYSQIRQTSQSHLTPDMAHTQPDSPRSSISPLPGRGRLHSGTLNHQRPSFADLSARRSSRPGFMLPGGGSPMAYRFPSSQSVRELHGQRQGGGAIIHLLGAPNQVLGATSANIPTARLSERGQGELDMGRVLSEMRISSEVLIQRTKRSVEVCKIIFGLESDLEEEVRVWTADEAIERIAEETQLLIEDEFKDLFSPRTTDDQMDGERSAVGSEGHSMDDLKNDDMSISDEMEKLRLSTEEDVTERI